MGIRGDASSARRPRRSRLNAGEVTAIVAAESADAQLLALLAAESGSSRLRATVALNACALPHVLRALAEDGDPVVHSRAHINSRTPCGLALHLGLPARSSLAG